MIATILDTTLPLAPRGGDAETLRLLVADVHALEQDDEALAAAVEGLSPQRRAKALAFSHRRGRALSAAAAMLLDAALQEHGLRERDMTYTENAHGRPELAASGLRFSISHSGTLAAVAVAARVVGMDIQAPTRGRQGLFRRVLSPAELGKMATLSPPEQNRLFQRLWTLKEAYAKALGTGLREPYPTPPPECVLHERYIGDYHLAICALPPAPAP